MLIVVGGYSVGMGQVFETDETLGRSHGDEPIFADEGGVSPLQHVIYKRVLKRRVASERKEDEFGLVLYLVELLEVKVVNVSGENAMESFDDRLSEDVGEGRGVADDIESVDEVAHAGNRERL